MDNFIAQVCADIEVDKLVELQHELASFSLRMPENTALLCIGIQKLLAYFS
jgi:hypothetical protein